MIFIGDSSYSIYLFHPLLLSVLRLLDYRIWLPMIVALCVIAGITVHLYIEGPLQNFLRQRWTIGGRGEPARLPDFDPASEACWERLTLAPLVVCIK